MVNITKVNIEFNGQIAYCKEETITTLGATINCTILWSGYKVRPMEPLCPPCDAFVKEEGIDGPLIQLQAEKVDNDFSVSDINTTDSEDEFGSHGVGAQEKVDKGDAKSASAYPDRLLWRGRICDLQNDNLTILGKAKIVVCLLYKPFDEENLGETNAGVFFLLDGNL